MTPQEKGKPIMEYVYSLEDKVREARKDAWNYQKLAFMCTFKSIQFFLGFATGLAVAGVGIIAFWIGEDLWHHLMVGITRGMGK